MIIIQLLLIILFTSILTGVFLYFIKQNKELKNRHLQREILLCKTISIHKAQIKYREKGLMRYNFLKFNLEESLRVQPDIKLL